MSGLLSTPFAQSCSPFKVVCIRASWTVEEIAQYPRGVPVKDKTYTVIGIMNYAKKTFYILQEIGTFWAWDHVHFRTIDETFAKEILENIIAQGAEIEEEMLQPL